MWEPGGRRPRSPPRSLHPGTALRHLRPRWRGGGRFWTPALAGFGGRSSGWRRRSAPARAGVGELLRAAPGAYTGGLYRGKRLPLRGRAGVRCCRPCAASLPPPVSPVPVGPCSCWAWMRVCCWLDGTWGHLRSVVFGISGNPMLLALPGCSSLGRGLPRGLRGRPTHPEPRQGDTEPLSPLPDAEEAVCIWRREVFSCLMLPESIGRICGASSAGAALAGWSPPESPSSPCRGESCLSSLPVAGTGRMATLCLGRSPGTACRAHVSRVASVAWMGSCPRRPWLCLLGTVAASAASSAPVGCRRSRWPRSGRLHLKLLAQIPAPCVPEGHSGAAGILPSPRRCRLLADGMARVQDCP